MKLLQILNEESAGTHPASTEAAEIIVERAKAFIEDEGKDYGYSLADIVEEQLDVFVDEIRQALKGVK